jgi:hypothetical protein
MALMIDLWYSTYELKTDGNHLFKLKIYQIISYIFIVDCKLNTSTKKYVVLSGESVGSTVPPLKKEAISSKTEASLVPDIKGQQGARGGTIGTDAEQQQVSPMDTIIPC